ncbi:hypothetical protein BKA70DRAFT_1578587 [Coprinopsis sp. MPI-PUGE-AT-0042]|nr:hypothetical protein BKA70DRAFT_1578587 [Coprinopsis sp. MPI-PUGE-AT-0042]
MRDVIEIDDDSIAKFNRTSWIGVGKAFPRTNVPVDLRAALNHEFSIPQQYQPWLLSPLTSIACLLQTPLPDFDQRLNLTRTSAWFSKVKAATDPDALNVVRNRPLPNGGTLRRLREASPQMWLDGCVSISDPRYNQGKDHIPLWFLTHWEQMTELKEQQDEWKAASKWLEDRQDAWQGNNTKTAMLDSVIASFDSIHLGSQVHLPSPSRDKMPVRFITRFLGEKWMSSDNVDFMLGTLQTRTAAQATKVLIMPTSFSSTVVHCGSTKKWDSNKEAHQLVPFERTMEEEGVELVYAPFNINGNHWIAVCIDLKKNEISYGDSLSHSYQSKPKEILKHVQAWSRERLHRSLKIRDSQPMGHARQKDIHSCGIITANTIAVAVFGDELWHAKTAELARIQWFSQAVGLIEEPVAKRDEPSVAPSRGTARITILSLLNPESEDESLGPAPTQEAELCNTPEEGQFMDKDLVEIQDNFDDVSSSPEYDSEYPPSTHASLSEGIADDDDAMDVEVQEEFSCGREDALVEEEEEMLVDADGWPLVEQDDAAPTGQKRQRSPKSPSRSVEEESRMGASGSKASGEGFEDDGETEGEEEAAEYPLVDDEEAPPSKKYRQTKSAEYETALRKAYRSGTLAIDEERLQEWRAKITAHDSNVLFNDDPTKLDTFWHPRCGKWILVKAMYDMTRYLKHHKVCTGSQNTQSLLSFFRAKPKDRSLASPSTSKLTTVVPASADLPPGEEVPCPGLTERVDKRVPIYLERTGANGGGGIDIRRIVKSVFKKAFSKLSKKKKEEAVDRQRITQKWANDHQNVRVHAADCQKMITARNKNAIAPCLPCRTVYKSKPFKTAIAKPLPEPQNRKFTNKRWINELLGKLFTSYHGLQDLVEDEEARHSPCVKYALGNLSGKYNEKTFEGLVNAYVTMQERQEKGKGMQNFEYSAEFLDMCRDLHATSPAAYRSLKDIIQMPAERTLQRDLSKQPKFPFSLGTRNFELAKQHLEEISYDGPVGLACDDTKLFSNLGLVHDPVKNKHFLIGGSDGPIEVLDPEQVRSVMEESKKHAGTKLRLWVLSIPYPKIPPIIIAALPITDKMKGDALADLSLKVILGLIRHGINLVSYTCDGTEVERSAEKIMISKADSSKVYRVTNPFQAEGAPDTIITVAIFNGQHVAFGQDSKHGLKTFRNNLFSGARLLSLGNFVAIYERIRALAHEAGSPLYIRDVEKTDRQDDSAATRLFSAPILEFIVKNHPDYIGEVVYLFVFGELIDAYQNRFITHHERVVMVLRARYFLDHWEMYLKACGYAKAAHIISREALDITRFLVDGYLSLLYIHRDFLKGKYPLLPWLHSTEPCEHLFGEARRIVKDFTFRDFIFMIPKLRLRVRRTMFHFRGINAKTRAVGYVHTYYDMSKLNPVNLMTFPTDEEIVELSEAAAAQCDSLFNILGVSPSRLRSLQQPLQPPYLPQLPPVSAWYTEDDGDGCSISSSVMSTEDNDESCVREELQTLFELPTADLTAHMENRVRGLRCSAFALEAEEAAHLRSLNTDPSGVDDDENEEFVAEEFGQISDFARHIVINDLHHDEPSGPVGLKGTTLDDLDLNDLVEIRRQHQTEQAAKCGRTRNGVQPSEEAMADANERNYPPDLLSDSAKTVAQLRQEIASTYHQVLRETKGYAPTSGIERLTRWTANESVDRPAAGNSANAAEVSAKTAATAAKKRANIFEGQGVPCLSLVTTGRVSLVRPLKPGDFVFCFPEVKGAAILIGKVVTMYSRTAGKNARNAAVNQHSNLSALSRIAVQIYEHDHKRQFGSTPAATSALSTKQYLLLAPYQVLFVLSTEPIPVGSFPGAPIQVTTTDYDHWKELQSKRAISSFQAAFVEFRKREPKIVE